jgi:hypothetical protein
MEDAQAEAEALQAQKLAELEKRKTKDARTKVKEVHKAKKLEELEQRKIKDARAKAEAL